MYNRYDLDDEELYYEDHQPQGYSSFGCADKWLKDFLRKKAREVEEMKLPTIE